MPVKPDRILRELSDLWVTMAKPESGEGGKADPGTGVLRACSMTLTVIVDDEDDSAALGETLAQIMRGHPSRAIVVRLRGTSDELEARVFAQCWMPFGHNRQICCEQVEITASLDRLHDVPSVVSPLVAPDLPRVVWFRSSRIANAPDIGDLLNLGDKLIVDSARHGSPAFADLRTLVTAGFVVGDLAWTRLTKLRELVAQLLQDGDTKAIRKVVIEYCGGAPGAEPKYLRGWLRAALPGVTVHFEVDADEGDGGVTGIRVEGEAEAVIVDIRVESGCARYSSGSLHQRANLSRGSEEELLSEELGLMRHDPVFEQTLQRMTIWTPKF